MQIALCDDSMDEVKVVERIVKHRVMQFPELEVKAYQCAEDMLEDFVHTKPFACILDIEMPGIDGLQLAEKISKCYPRTYLVFCSKRDELVFQAIHRQPISFVRKKYLETELAETMDLLLKHYRTDYKL